MSIRILFMQLLVHSMFWAKYYFPLCGVIKLIMIIVRKSSVMIVFSPKTELFEKQLTKQFPKMFSRSQCCDSRAQVN